MNTKNFFRLVLKILGLLLISIGVIPSLSSFFLYITDDIAMSLLLFGAMLLYLIVCYFLIFDSDYLIDKLKLTKNFDEDTFTFENIKESLLLELSCIIIGLYAVINSLPTILLGGFLFFRENAQSYGILSAPINSNNYFYVDLIYFFLGLIFIALRKQISLLLK